MTPLPSEKKNYKTGILFALLNIVLVAALVPLLMGIAHSAAQVGADRRETVRLKAEAQELRYVKQHEAEYTEHFAAADAILYEGNPVGFITFLETTAAAKGVSLEMSIVENGKESSNKTVFQLSTKGSFSATLSFLSAIEESPYLITTNRAVMDRPDEKSSSGDIQATFLIAVTNT